MKNTSRKSASSTNLSSPKKYPSAPKELPPNLISIETEKRNKLNTKVTPFKKYRLVGILRQFAHTTNVTEKKSQCLKLADSVQSQYIQIYSKTFGSGFNLAQRHHSATKDSIVVDQSTTNPENGDQTKMHNSIIDSVMISTLNSKTHKIPEYNVMVRDMNHEKGVLEMRIENLKRKIAAESKNISGLKHVQNQHINQIDHLQDNLEKKRAETAKAIYNHDIVAEECNQLRREIAQLNSMSANTKKDCERESKTVEDLKEFNTRTKKQLLKEDHDLNDLKFQLTVALKAMNNNSSLIKYLESERAEMLLYINKETEQNRIKV